MMNGIKEFTDAIAKQRGITQEEAKSIAKDCVEIMGTLLCNGGLSFKGVFTLRPKVVPSRTGTVNGVEYTTKKHRKLVFKVGKTLDAELNKDIEAEEYVCDSCKVD